MMQLSDKVSKQSPFDVLIFLTNVMTVIANRNGKRTVTRNDAENKTRVDWPETMLSDLRNCTLLSVPTLVRKVLAAVVIPENENLIDIVDEYRIIVIAAQSQMTRANFPKMSSSLLLVSLVISSKQ